MLFGYAEKGEKVYYLIHEFDIRASTSILGVLQDIGEERDKRGHGEVEYQP